mgnify:CR=1 FL=1
MNKKFLASCIGLSLLAAQVQADYLVDLQLELSSSSGEFEYDDSRFDDLDTESNGSDISGTVFFSRVSTENTPIREAAFLSHNSSVTVGRSALETDFEYRWGDVTDKTNEIGVSGRFVIPGPSIILIAGLSEGENKFGSGTDRDVDSYQLGGGWYITDQSALTLTYTESEYEPQRSNAKLEDSEWFDVNYRQVMKLGSSQHLAFHVTVGTFDDGYGYDEVSVGGGVVWYLSNQFGLGVSVLSSSGDRDNYEESSFELTPYISYDFSENFGIYGELNILGREIDSDFAGDDIEYAEAGITFGANARF